VAWVGLAYGLGVPQTVKVTLSSAQLLDLANTPVDLIAAPGAGLSIVINTFTVKYTYGTVPYDFAGALYCGFSSIIASTTTLANVSNSALATTNNVSGSVFATTFGTTDRLVSNDKLQISTDTNPTVGDGTLTLWISYTTILL
jgi:hypothetical protein